MWEPFGTAPANVTAFWKSGPDERGTLNILSICIITLLLCAYTSLHLDIPKHGKAGWTHQGWRRFLWVLAGLSAPEVVTYVAFRQWLFARKLEDQMIGILGNLLPKSKKTASQGDAEDIPLIDSAAGSDNKEDKSSEKKYSWTRVHSHFALMGGYVFQHGEARDTLTANALRKLARNAPALLPDLSKEFIRDKSKANGFAKFLVCVQTIWFIAQTIGRLATGLPISLLELNTLCHAFCCLFIYMAWWHKPLDIEEPFLIQASDGYASKIRAWMYENDHLNLILPLRRQDSNMEPKGTWSQLPNFQMLYQDDITSSPASDAIKTAIRDKISSAKEYNKRHNRATELTAPDYASQWTTVDDKRFLILYPGQKIHGFVLYDDHNALSTPAGQGIYSYISLDRIERLRLIQSLCKKEGATNPWCLGIPGDAKNNAGTMLNENSLFMSSDESLKKWRRSRWADPDTVLYTGLLVAGSAYGAVHLFAWNGPFPTKIQRLLWRVSCIIITSPVVIIALYYFIFVSGYLIWSVLSEILKAIDNCLKISSLFGWLVRLVKWLRLSDAGGVVMIILLVIVGLAASLAYVGARLYLVVECFINVAHLPEGVFLEPSWSQYIPHFGAG